MYSPGIVKFVYCFIDHYTHRQFYENVSGVNIVRSLNKFLWKVYFSKQVFNHTNTTSIQIFITEFRYPISSSCLHQHIIISSQYTLILSWNFTGMQTFSVKVHSLKWYISYRYLPIKLARSNSSRMQPLMGIGLHFLCQYFHWHEHPLFLQSISISPTYLSGGLRTLRCVLGKYSANSLL